MKKVRVVAALLKERNLILIAQRKYGQYKGYWEFPGGKVEAGERDDNALKREIKEEMGVDIEVGELVANTVFDNSNSTVEIFLYESFLLSNNFKLNDHDQMKWITMNTLFEYNLLSADLELAKQMKKGTKVMNEDSQIESKSLKVNFEKNVNDTQIRGLKINKIYTNAEIKNIFKCSNMGGMRRSKNFNSLVLISKHDAFYNDSWKGSVLHYTGMGMSGDQSLDYSQNKTLNHSAEMNIKVFLFESYSADKYYFRGEVYLCGKPYQDKEIDDKGNIRKVWKFPIRRRDENEKMLIDESDYEDGKSKAEKKVREIPTDDLKEQTKGKAKKPSEKEVISKRWERDLCVVEATKRRANGICELCREQAPFNKKNGEPYLEAHHIITLAEGGLDSMCNTVALCPNCHKKMHIVKNKKDKEALIEIVLRYLLDENDRVLLKKFHEIFEKGIKVE